MIRSNHLRANFAFRHCSWLASMLKEIRGEWKNNTTFFIYLLINARKCHNMYTWNLVSLWSLLFYVVLIEAIRCGWDALGKHLNKLLICKIMAWMTKKLEVACPFCSFFVLNYQNIIYILGSIIILCLCVVLVEIA